MDSAIFKFGIICDCQYTDADSDVGDGGVRALSYGVAGNTVSVVRNRQYRQSLAKLDRAIASFNSEKTNFVFHLGDLADRSIEDYHPVRQSLSRATMPVHQVIGNRDYLACGGDSQAVCHELGLATPSYSFVHGKTRFIILDSNELGIINTKPDTPARRQAEDYIESLQRQEIIYAHPSNGGIGDSQYQWLVGELDEATAQHQSIIVMSHHPLYPLDIHNMLNSSKILQLLSRYPVTAYMNGHNHAGNYGVQNDTPFITFPGLVEGQADAYSIAQVTAGSVDITGYGTHSSYSLSRKFA